MNSIDIITKIYGRNYILTILFIIFLSLVILTVGGIELYEAIEKYYSLEKFGVLTKGEVIKKEEITGFRGGSIYIYYRFKDKDRVVEGKQMVDRFMYDSINIGDEIEIKYIKDNPEINGILKNKAEIINKLPIIIPFAVFLISIIILIRAVIKAKKISFLLKHGERTEGRVVKSEFRGGTTTIYYRFSANNKVYNSKLWLPYNFKVNTLVNVVYDKNNPEGNIIYEVLKDG